MVQLSQSMLREASGQYHLEAIRKLYLPNLGISAVDELQYCTALEELSAPGNSLTVVPSTPLSGCASTLRRVALQRNAIVRVEDISSFQSLEHLLLQGNRIEHVDDLNLHALSQLPKLRSLYLRNFDGSEANPVCHCSGYRASVVQALPELRNLDGERLQATANTEYRGAMRLEHLSSLDGPTAETIANDAHLSNKEQYECEGSDADQVAAAAASYKDEPLAALAKLKQSLGDAAPGRPATPRDNAATVDVPKLEPFLPEDASLEQHQRSRSSSNDVLPRDDVDALRSSLGECNQINASSKSEIKAAWSSASTSHGEHTSRMESTHHSQ